VNSKNAQHAKATRGESVRDDTTVATMVDESRNPLLNAKVSAKTAVTTARWSAKT
jgi:hypothetical protein